MPVKVSSVMSRKVATVSPGTSLVTVGRKMTEMKISCVIVKDMEIAHDKMKNLAIRDYLTGMFNRRLFMATLEKEFYRSRRYDAHMSLIMIYIDDFKEINDKHGHQHGDRVPQSVSDIIRRQTGEADIAARFGGEEEFIVLTHGSDTEPANRLAERLRTAISESGVTVSCGVAHYPNSKSLFPEDLIRLSDEALYAAKRQGKNQVVRWNEKLTELENVA